MVTNKRTTGTKKKIKLSSVMKKTIFPLAKLIVVIVCVGMIANIIGQKAAKPFRLYSREYKETQKLATQVSNMKKENAELRSNISRLKTPQGSATAARKIGWVKPGEITLVIPQDNSDKNKK